eukprot:GHVH01007358.1.p1 GENE.GHVH01007358.1~~GHVH01007358.1.p1  ORF type:complete len:180 (+),score=26.71 GHVH01007358.1:63-602(+)
MALKRRDDRKQLKLTPAGLTTSPNRKPPGPPATKAALFDGSKSPGDKKTQTDAVHFVDGVTHLLSGQTAWTVAITGFNPPNPCDVIPWDQEDFRTSICSWSNSDLHILSGHVFAPDYLSPAVHSLQCQLLMQEIHAKNEALINSIVNAEILLRRFDLNGDYGPCRGISRVGCSIYPKGI